MGESGFLYITPSLPPHYGVKGAMTMYFHDLTDLLNGDGAAYTYFYSLSPKTQEQLQKQHICSLDQLRRAVDDIRLRQRPEVF